MVSGEHERFFLCLLCSSGPGARAGREAGWRIMKMEPIGLGRYADSQVGVVGVLAEAAVPGAWYSSTWYRGWYGAEKDTTNNTGSDT